MRQISLEREYFQLYLLLKVIVQEADLLSSWLFHTKTWLVGQQYYVWSYESSIALTLLENSSGI